MVHYCWWQDRNKDGVNYWQRQSARVDFWEEQRACSGRVNYWEGMEWGTFLLIAELGQIVGLDRLGKLWVIGMDCVRVDIWKGQWTNKSGINYVLEMDCGRLLVTAEQDQISGLDLERDRFLVEPGLGYILGGVYMRGSRTGVLVRKGMIILDYLKLAGGQIITRGQTRIAY